MNDPRQHRLWSIPGDGVLAREGDLVLLSAIDDRDFAESLLDLLMRTAQAGGDGRALADAVGAAIERHQSWGGLQVPAVVAFGPAGSGLAFAVSGKAFVEIVTAHGPHRLAAGVPSMAQRTVVGVPVEAVRGGLGGHGPGDRTDRFSRLDSGTVRAWGLSFSAGGPALATAAPGMTPPAMTPPAMPPLAAVPPGPAPSAPAASAPAPSAPARPGPAPSAPAPPSAVPPGPVPPAPAQTPPPAQAPGRGTAAAEWTVPEAAEPPFMAEPPRAAEPPRPAEPQRREEPPAAREPSGAEPGLFQPGPVENPYQQPDPAAPPPFVTEPEPASYQQGPMPPPYEAGPYEPEAAAYSHGDPRFAEPAPGDPGVGGPGPGGPDAGLAALADLGIEEPGVAAPAPAPHTWLGPAARPEEEPPAAAPDTTDAEEAQDSSGAPIVFGVRCKNGHFTDPDARSCVACGATIGRRTAAPQRGPRPTLGVLILDDGATVELDGDYVIGRDPVRDPAVSAGEARPLRVVDAESTVSRVHARVHLDGWQVVLTDLGSANGTRIHPPGAKTEQALGPRAPVPLQHGTRIYVGAPCLRYERIAARQ